MEKMTKRNFYTALVNYAATGEFSYDGTVVSAEEIQAFATHEIEMLDNRVQKAKTRKATAPDVLADEILSVLDSTPRTIAEILTRVSDENATAGKVTARLTKLANSGVVVKSDIKIPTTEGSKSRTVKGYARA